MKGPYPSRKRHVLSKLKMARSGQGWQRLKILLILPSAKIRSRGSSRQGFGATELGSPIINTSRSLMSIANMAPTCQESGLTQGQSIPASSSLPSLVPPFASPSSSFSSPDPSWCFFLLPLLLLSYQGRSSSQYGCYQDKIWKDSGAELKNASGCLFVLFFIISVICFLHRLV